MVGTIFYVWEREAQRDCCWRGAPPLALSFALSPCATALLSASAALCSSSAALCSASDALFSASAAPEGGRGRGPGEGYDNSAGERNGCRGGVGGGGISLQGACKGSAGD